MNTKKLLTSVAVFGIFTIPAMADIASNAESATCDSGTVGVSSGSTILEAQWTAQQIQCSAGQYLESDTAQCTACPAGSYCEGGLYTFSGSDLGITSACPTDYTSDGSAASTADCYRSCTTADVAHSLTVSGKYYYGDNNQCAPATCEANTINISWDPKNGEQATNNQCTYDGAVTIPATPSKVGYDFAGWHVNNNN